jgi:hypothetical protein
MEIGCGEDSASEELKSIKQLYKKQRMNSGVF